MRISKAEWIGMFVEIGGVLVYLVALFVIAIVFAR